MAKPSANRVIGFVRSADDISADDQRLRLEEHCVQNRLRLIDVVVGDKREPEKAIGEAIAICCSRSAKTLVVFRRECFADDPLALPLLEQFAARRGIQIASLTSQASDEDLALSAAAKMIDRVRLIVHVRETADIKRAIGKRWAVGRPPYGFRIQSGEDHRLVWDPKERRVIALVLRLRAKGVGYQAIADECFVRGFRSRKGGKFQITQIVRILKRFAANGEGPKRGSGLNHYVNSSGDPGNPSAASNATPLAEATVLLAGKDPTSKRAA